MLFDKPLEHLTEADLKELISNEVREDRALEYKRELTLSTNEDKKEFAKDVSALSNTTGGFIIYGMDAKDGIARQLVPLAQDDLDGELLRLESCLRDGVEPRIPDVRFQPVDIAGGRVLVARVRQSWAAPHMVKLGG